MLADDSLLVREGLARVLTRLAHQVVATASHADQVLGLVNRHRPDAIVMDIRMPPTHTDEGLRLTAKIRERHPLIAVLVLSQYVEPAYAATLLEEGGARVGYLLKDSVFAPATVDEALRRLHEGGTVLDPDLVRHLIRTPRSDDPLGRLTSREIDVLALMAQGLSDRGIAERLHLSQPTVSTHSQNLFRKLDLPNDPTDNRRVNAVLRYLRHSNTGL
jgi:DNA-binding NarL/FixJ family response regulator